MSRNFNKHLIAAGMAVALLSIAQAASANIFVDLQVDPSSPGYNAATPRNITFGAGGQNSTYLLDVYALITPNGTNTATPTNEAFSFLASNFFVANSTLKGDVSFGGFNTTAAPAQISTLNSSPNSQYGGSTGPFNYTTLFGGLGIGGTASTDTTATHWVYIQGNNLNTTGGAVLSNNAGVEYLLGTISVSFSSYVMPASTTTAVMGAQPWFGSVTAKKYAWTQDGASQSGLQGNNALVGYGASSASLLYGSSAVGVSTPFGPNSVGAMSFTFTTGGGANNPAAMAANLGISGPTTILGGLTTSLTGNVTNTGAAPVDTLNWATSGPGIVSLTPSSGAIATAGGTTPITGTLTAPATGFGPWVSVVTFAGSDNSTPLPSQPKALNFNVIGKGTWQAGGADGNGVGAPTLPIAGPYGTLLTTQGSLAAGANLAGLTTTLGSAATSFGIGQTTATILAGTLVGATTGVSEQWRSRGSNETPAGAVAAGGAAAGFLPLYGDVVNLTGITGGSAQVYALQMTYDPAQLGSTEQNAASGGFLYLGYRSSTDGKWHNATAQLADGNTAPGGQAAPAFQGSYAAYTTSVGGGFTLAGGLGSWGVDTVNKTVWAIINHDAEFAPVPEPGTIALLVGGIAALGFAYRRRKVAKA